MLSWLLLFCVTVSLVQGVVFTICELVQEVQEQKDSPTEYMETEHHAGISLDLCITNEFPYFFITKPEHPYLWERTITEQRTKALKCTLLMDAPDQWEVTFNASYLIMDWKLECFALAALYSPPAVRNYVEQFCPPLIQKNRTCIRDETRKGGLGHLILEPISNNELHAILCTHVPVTSTPELALCTGLETSITSTPSQDISTNTTTYESTFESNAPDTTTEASTTCFPQDKSSPAQDRLLWIILIIMAILTVLAILGLAVKKLIKCVTATSIRPFCSYNVDTVL